MSKVSGGSTERGGQMITVVTGFTRSGTSLMMRMLHVGGMDVYAENPFSYETHDNFRLPHDTDWLSQAENKAMKILEPLEFYPPRGREYRFIFMTRDPIQQAKSQLKFLSATMEDFEVSRHALTKIKRSLKRDTPKAIEMLISYPASQLIVVPFEALIAHPTGEAMRVSRLCGGLNVLAMAGTVIERSSDCLPYFLELEQIAEGRR